MIYRFGDCELDSASYRLLRNGRPVDLTPKAFQLLCALIEQPAWPQQATDMLSVEWRGVVRQHRRASLGFRDLVGKRRHDRTMPDYFCRSSVSGAIAETSSDLVGRSTRKSAGGYLTGGK